MSSTRRCSAPVWRVRRVSRSRSRPELKTPRTRGSGAPRGAVAARPEEAEKFEREYPGSSWRSSRALRELEVVGAKAEALVAALARKHKLTHAALNALAVIEGAGAPLPAGEVSARMHITTGTMTSVLDTLERNGYIVRQPNPEDRRSVLVDITPSAQAVLDRLLPEVQLAARSVFATLDDDALRSLLDHLAVARAAIESFAPHLSVPAIRVRPATLRRG